MDSFPLFIVGAPRSGTTFLCSLLNEHPLIQLTNECRIFALLKESMEVSSRRADLLSQNHRETFIRFSNSTLGDWVERFYREGLDISAPIWGDKHPPYADPTILSGRRGSVERLPRSGSCLRLIRELLPNARFIHIHRDPGRVAHSLMRKRWTGSVEDGVRIWGQYVTEILDFFEDMPAGQTSTIAYRSLIEDPESTITNIGNFLALRDTAPLRNFLRAQRGAPTPFSDPVTNVAELYIVPNQPPTDARLLALAHDAAMRLGYGAARSAEVQ